MFEIEVLIGKGLGAVNGGTPTAITVEKIASLDHEIFDLHGLSQGDLRTPKRLARAGY